MKRIRSLVAALVIAFAVTLPPAALLTGCKNPSRASYNTIASVGKAVDVAEREYLDKMIAGTVKTNNFTQIQASYQAFQDAYKATVAIASNDTNSVSPQALSQAASKFILDVQTAIKSK